jgi:hypothetical protein
MKAAANACLLRESQIKTLTTSPADMTVAECAIGQVVSGTDEDKRVTNFEICVFKYVVCWSATHGLSFFYIGIAVFVSNRST